MCVVHSNNKQVKKYLNSQETHHQLTLDVVIHCSTIIYQNSPQNTRYIMTTKDWWVIREQKQNSIHVDHYQ